MQLRSLNVTIEAIPQAQICKNPELIGLAASAQGSSPMGTQLQVEYERVRIAATLEWEHLGRQL